MDSSQPQISTADPLLIQMLGDFVLRRGPQSLSGDKIRAKQVWTLLEYLLVNRGQDISPEKLLHTLWPEDEIEDPAGALKNLVYRLRKTLQRHLGLESGAYILYRHGSYTWNTELPCTIDAELFAQEAAAAQQPELPPEARLHSCQTALAIYKGDFLCASAYKEWVAPLTVHYQRLYMQTVQTAATLLIQTHQYVEAEEICRRAIALNPFVEENHLLLMQALQGENEPQKAIAHYQELKKLLNDELGVEPSPACRQFYESIQEKNDLFERDMDSVKKDLQEVGAIQGAMLCDFEVFRTLYRYQVRSSLRSGKSIYIALFTLENHNTPSRPTLPEELLATVCRALRKDDVITSYGNHQFLLMLSNITYEDTERVLRRLSQKIAQVSVGRWQFFGQMQVLEPLEIQYLHEEAPQ